MLVHVRYSSYGNLKHKTPKKPIKYIGAYFVLYYAIWTLFNVLRYLRAPESCFKDQTSNINMTNYTLLMLLGVFPLTILILALTFGLVLAGMVTKSFFTEHRKRNIMSQKDTISKYLVSFDFNAETFDYVQSSTCSICLESFENNDLCYKKVTPLPC